MLCNLVAVEPSETLAPLDCDGADVMPSLPLLARDELSFIGLAGRGLPGLSIFTLILSVQNFPVSSVIASHIGNKTKNFR